MSGQDIPYQLRPNKFIDRQMFVEGLARMIVPRGPEKYIYVSMGGRHLVDHFAVYNQLGVAAQYSFDKNANEVKRQIFNRPTGKTVCEILDTAQLPAKIDYIFSAFPGKPNLIVWLDYTNTDRRTQLQEALQTLIRLKHGDIFRVTLNASANSLGAGDEWKQKGAAGPGEYRATRLRDQIIEFMPTDITTITDDTFPAILARCVELVAQAAESQSGIVVKPVLITSYKDGARMLTVTCAISEPNQGEQFPSPSLSRWRFKSDNWNDLRSISAPVLSSRERHSVDARLHRGVKRMLAGLSFLTNGDEKASLTALESYRQFHRYYPTFRNVED